MADFDRILKFTLGVEGGFSNLRGDPGGATQWGITHYEYDSWRTRHGLPLQPVTGMTETEMKAIYREDYWDPHRCDEMSDAWALAIFDAAVNLRAGESVKLAQGALYAAGAYESAIDGVVGPATLAAMNAHPELAEQAAIWRYGYHVAETNPIYLHGLINRVRHEISTLKSWNDA